MTSTARTRVKFEDEQWRCTWCGAVVDDIEPDKLPVTELRANSGQPNVRVVLVDNVEKHRCEGRPGRGT